MSEQSHRHGSQKLANLRRANSQFSTQGEGTDARSAHSSWDLILAFWLAGRDKGTWDLAWVLHNVHKTASAHVLTEVKLSRGWSQFSTEQHARCGKKDDTDTLRYFGNLPLYPQRSSCVSKPDLRHCVQYVRNAAHQRSLCPLYIDVHTQFSGRFAFLCRFL